MSKLRYNRPTSRKLSCGIGPWEEVQDLLPKITQSQWKTQDENIERLPPSPRPPSREDPHRCYGGESRGGVGWQAVGGLSENLAGVWGPRRSLVDPKLLALMEREAGSGGSEGRMRRQRGRGLKPNLGLDSGHSQIGQ